MEKMKQHFLKSCNIALLASLALLGFASCEREPLEEGEERFMYGTPRSELVIKDKVEVGKEFINLDDDALRPEDDE